jgi:hypothetical protein
VRGRGLVRAAVVMALRNLAIGPLEVAAYQPMEELPAPAHVTPFVLAPIDCQGESTWDPGARDSPSPEDSQA